MMKLTLLSLALSAVGVNAAAVLRFSCSQLVVERLDPYVVHLSLQPTARSRPDTNFITSLVNPGVEQSPHLHQIVGGNAFSPSMNMDIPATATCTTCTFADDFSNYWTAVLYFRARNGTFKRVQQMPNVGFEQAKGGMTVYYSGSGKSSVTAFKPVSPLFCHIIMS